MKKNRIHHYDLPNRRVSSSTLSIDPRDLVLYRDRTSALLRRYMRISMETGRLPSLLGKEFFRAKVTSYRMSTFEDAVVFVHDVERCLERLDSFSQTLIARIVLQDYEFEEAARLIQCSLRTVERRFPQALDALSRIFLELELLAFLPAQAMDYDRSHPSRSKQSK